MRYWVYINDKVDGPYEEDKLGALDGFTPDTLICSEEIEEGGSQEWVKASSVFEFDEASKTMTRAPLTQEELNIVNGNSSDVTATSPITQPLTGADASATQILIEKIDYLTREIEGLKSKLDAALAANVSVAPQVQQHPAAQEEPATAHQHEPITEEAAITDTESLVSHAEQLVAQASNTTEEKPVDFLDEIQIGASKTESLAGKGGEEVVLRSALDSLYNAKPETIQTEEEKESTFQDLLSSAKVITEPKIEQPQAENKEEPVVPAKAEEPAEAPKVQEPAPQPEEKPAEGLQISDEKREEIINEITAPAQQDNFILQAISEAQKEDGLPLAQEKEEPLSIQQPGVKEEPVQAQPADLPSLQAQPQEQEVKEKESLDLTDQPQLNIVNEEEAAPAPAPEQAPVQQVQDIPQVSDMVTPLNPENEPEPVQKEITETIKELVPGKKIEPQQQEEEGLISQADLDEAFAEHDKPTPEFPIPEDKPAQQQPQPEAEQAQGLPQADAVEVPTAAAEATGTLPEGKGFYNPNEMTEVELKEGSTYLISDFIPPALATPGSKDNAIPQAYGAVPGSSEAAQASAEGQPANTLQVKAVTETVEEMVPEQKADQADLTLSKVILENTIKTKRGATMDIKTVPMVQEPADSERLDLSEADLDINTQHDLKAADLKQGGKGATKMVFGALASVVILALIYVMLAYLEIIPQQFNFIKSAPAAVQVQDEQLNEMLGDAPSAPITDNMQQAPIPQQNGMAQPMPGQQLPAGSMPMQQGQMLPGQNQNAVMNAILAEVKNFRMVNGQTLEQLINSRHPAAQNLIEWTITTAVEPDNYSILVKVPPENPQSFKIPYRFNYNTVTKTLEPTISDSKNLLDSLKPQQPAR